MIQKETGKKDKGYIIDFIINRSIPLTNREAEGNSTYPARKNPTYIDLTARIIWTDCKHLDIGSIIFEMLALKIIEEKHEQYYAAELGYNIKQIGGWNKYLEYESVKKLKDEKTLVLLKRQIYWFWFGVAISVIVPAITITYQVTTANKTQSRIDTLQLQLNSLKHTHSTQPSTQQTTTQKADTSNAAK